MPTAQMLLNKFNNVKTLPHVAIRLSKLISDENSTIQQFEEIIRLDPTLVLRLLRLVNSSYYGLCQKVESISKAVVFIGTKNLRNMVVVEALKDIFKEREKNDTFSRTKLWLHCAAVSICARMISERIFEQKGEDAFLAGTLHDIGMIVENQVVQDLFLQVCEAYKNREKPLIQYEKEVIGTHHSSVGYLLAREWKLPFAVQEAIKNHHSILNDISPSSITGIIQIADYIISKLNYPAILGMEETLSPFLENHMEEMMGEYKTLIRDLPEEMEKAKDLYEIQAEEQS
ncbi:MAG: HDOD domain-containing protein [Candidatus Hodarchaeota archaeon]